MKIPFLHLICLLSVIQCKRVVHKHRTSYHHYPKNKHNFEKQVRDLHRMGSLKYQVRDDFYFHDARSRNQRFREDLWRYRDDDPYGDVHPIRHHPELSFNEEIHWPVKKEAVVEGDIILGGLMMVHEREDSVTCGPVMPQGGIQALEAMLYTLDRLNGDLKGLLPDISLGAHILDDCDKDTYGLEMAVDFIKGKSYFAMFECNFPYLP